MPVPRPIARHPFASAPAPSTVFNRCFHPVSSGRWRVAVLPTVACTPEAKRMASHKHSPLVIHHYSPYSMLLATNDWIMVAIAAQQQHDGEACAVFALSIQPRHRRTILYHVCTFRTTIHTLNVIDYIANASRLYCAISGLRVSSQTCLHIFRHCLTTCRIYQMSPRPLQASRTLHTPLPSRIHIN